jgi:NTE family protein
VINIASPFRIPLPSHSVFDSLDAEVRTSLEAELVWFSVPGGRVLFRENDPATGLYLVLSGCLGLIAGSVTHDEPSVLVQVGEVVGQYTMLLNRPQISTCVAIRDTSLAWLSKSGFDRLLRDHPESVLAFAGQLIEMFNRVLSFHQRPFNVPRNLALIPLHAGAPTDRLAAALAASILKGGGKAIFLDHAAAGQRAEFLQAVEDAHDLVIYCGDTADSDWTRTCIRQSDRVLLVALAAEPPRDHAALLDKVKELPWRQAELVLLQPDDTRSPAAAESWLNHVPVRFHCHLRLGNAADIARLARYAMGRALGLVLSGGGARGFGHIGVIKALRAAGVPIDMLGGTSMGAIIAAGVALEWDDQEMYERMHAGFVRSNPLGDYAIPFVALIKGKKVERRLRRHFPDSRVEDLWRPYFAVAANLTNGEVAVLRRGPLWRALRASIAIPGLLPPVIEAGEVLVDGGVMNNLPTDVMDTMRRGPIIGVDITHYRGLQSSMASAGSLGRLFAPSGYEGPGIVSILLRAATVGGTLQAKSHRDHADLILAPPMETIAIRDWHSFDRAIEEGYRHTMERIAELERFVEKGGVDREAPAGPLTRT